MDSLSTPALFLVSIIKYIGIEHFENYSLTQNDVMTAGALFAFIICAFFYVGKQFVTDQKRIAWLVSLINSFVMTLLGVLYLTARIPLFDGLFSYGIDSAIIFHEPTSNFTAMTCLWFAVANILDLAFGFVYYRKYLGYLTAYVHHSVFIWTMLACTTGNAIFFQTEPFAGTFCVCLIEELPTFLLALGSVFPMFRTDWGFGLTFFLLRILYHAYFLSYAFHMWVGAPTKVLFVCTFALHFTWFKTWINKYGMFAPKKISKKKFV